MDLEQRLKQLTSTHDYQGVVEALEQGIGAASDPTAKADLHLRLGRLLRSRFLQGVRALKHFQDAYKQNPALVEALAEARAVYWDLGKLNMVQKLLELQLKAAPDSPDKSALYRQLGDVLSDLGEYERATEAYAKALQSANGKPGDIPELLQDVQVGDAEWQARLSSILKSARGSKDAPSKAQLFLRGARLARRFAPDQVEDLLAQAYAADPIDQHVAATYEGLLVDSGRTDAILESQRAVLAHLNGTAEQADASFIFGARWALRHTNLELGSQLVEEALRAEPSREEAFTFLRDVYGARGGDWERVISLADELADRSTLGPKASYLLAQAGLIAWRERGDLIRARRSFERLARLDPENPALRAFEAQIGETLRAEAEPEATGQRPRRSKRPKAEPKSEPAASEAAETPTAPPMAEEIEPMTSPPPAAREPEPTPAAAPAAALPEPAAALPEPAPAPSAPAVPAKSENAALVAELREKLAQQAAAKRHHEYVKTLIALGDALADPAERVPQYLEAGELYATKFANQAEAARAYERVLELDASQTKAVAYLRDAYEKRRDWEKLIALMVREAEFLPEGSERAQKFKQVALLATDKVKKPEVCIDLWAIVLQNDAEDIDALNALAGLYERSREYEKLADVLAKLAELTYDTPAKIELLNKLGQVAGDRLKDDERAVDAYRMLLTLSPDDRRAQEQLKKRYVTLGRWDDLEVFYAESGKWDEFIRVLESNETRATDDAQRVGMLMKIAELWLTQKGKLDRAARAYEKVLSIDASNLHAAERLVPIYQSANNPKGLSQALEVKLAHVSDPGERLGLLREVAGLYETRLNEKPKAFERYLAAFGLAPDDPQTQADVERVAKVTSGWEAVVTAYRAAIEHSNDSAEQNALRLRLGRVLVEEVSRVDDALSEYRAVYESEPDNETALGALEGLYRRAGRFRELLEVQNRKLELAADAVERKRIRYEVAKLYEKELGDVASAIETHQAVLEEDPADEGALAALDGLYERSGQWEPYVEVLRKRIELSSDDRLLVDLKFRLARALYDYLGDAAGALENYREILFLDAEHEGARTALEGMLAERALSGEAASILEGIYEARGDW
ncbi:MAG TPA: hypothetical protein VLJ38_08385, partial [Polyangiaceae bacterium]|nr:hypothetical protein [Polyangiaceae bacterium]